MKNQYLIPSLQKTIVKFCAILAFVLILPKHGQAGECDLPPGVVVDGSNIKGQVALSLGGGQTANMNLFVQNITFSDGRCAAQVYRGAALLWQSLYNDYVSKGITAKNIQRLVDSITGTPTSGVYVASNLSACGYTGLAKQITCGPSADSGQKKIMAHENMHGWQFPFVYDASGIQFYEVFTHFSNLVYKAYVNDPASLMVCLS
jgi:hypothetical protein